jgi:hypothetical protein
VKYFYDNLVQQVLPQRYQTQDRLLVPWPVGGVGLYESSYIESDERFTGNQDQEDLSQNSSTASTTETRNTASASDSPVFYSDYCDHFLEADECF